MRVSYISVRIGYYEFMQDLIEEPPYVLIVSCNDGSTIELAPSYFRKFLTSGGVDGCFKVVHGNGAYVRSIERISREEFISPSATNTNESIPVIHKDIVNI
ncbi:hypothetical protein VCHA53O466_140179 [Vibrio chagasii]|nr:hypothetical protein VCHA53O466_140179 [Vibrio chagasii]